MISEYKMREISWIDVIAPTKQELRDLGEKYAISEKSVANLLSLENTNKVFIENGMLYVSLPFPAKGDKSVVVENIIFAISKKHILTIHLNDFVPIQKFTHSVSADKLIKTTDLSFHSMNIFRAIIDTAYQDINDYLMKLNAKIGKLEISMFKQKPKRTAEMTYYLSRDLNFLHNIITEHFDLIELSKASSATIFDDISDSTHGIINASLVSLRNKAESAKAAVVNLKETTVVLQHNRSKKHMLWIVAIFGLVLILSGILFSVVMHNVDDPIVSFTSGNLLAYSLILLGTVSIVTVLIKIKKWL